MTAPTREELERAIVEAIEWGLSGESIAGIDSLIERFPALATKAEEALKD